jgi:hypothetical protein
MIVFLDSNILGLISNPNSSFDECQQCEKWFKTLSIRGARFFTSDICDYEVRRGLISSFIRSGKPAPGIAMLDALRIVRPRSIVRQLKLYPHPPRPCDNIDSQTLLS